MRRWGASDVAARAAELGLIYAEAYRDPPYHEGERETAAFLQHLPKQPDQPGFAMVVAEAPDGHACGFAFGFTFEPGTWWKPDAHEPDIVRHAQRFAVMELAVRPAFHGRGIATALMTDLLSDRPEPFATLCANPQAVARQIYAAWGWEQAGTVNPPEVGPMDVMLKRLPRPDSVLPTRSSPRKRWQ